jgi:hypothetical protein
MALMELISKEGLDLDTLSQKVTVFGGGVALFTFKSFVETLISMIKNKMNFRKQIY